MTTKNFQCKVLDVPSTYTLSIPEQLDLERRGRSISSDAEVHHEYGGGASKLVSSSNEDRSSFYYVTGPLYQKSTHKKKSFETVKQYRPIN